MFGIWLQPGNLQVFEVIRVNPGNGAFPTKAEKLICCQKIHWEEQVDDGCQLVDCVVRP